MTYYSSYLLLLLFILPTFSSYFLSFLPSPPTFYPSYLLLLDKVHWTLFKFSLKNCFPHKFREINFYDGFVIKVWLCTVNVYFSITVYTPCKFWSMIYEPWRCGTTLLMYGSVQCVFLKAWFVNHHSGN